MRGKTGKPCSMQVTAFANQFRAQAISVLPLAMFFRLRRSKDKPTSDIRLQLRSNALEARRHDLGINLGSDRILSWLQW